MSSDLYMINGQYVSPAVWWKTTAEIREAERDALRLRAESAEAALADANVELEKWRSLFRNPKGSPTSPAFTKEDFR